MIDGQKQEFIYSSYLLRHHELVRMMREVGFTAVQEKPCLKGDTGNYTVFVGSKEL